MDADSYIVELILRGLLNADVVGFHTFDYARHFLSCCTRLLGLTYTTNRGSLCIDYYGRQVSVKICPTGVKTDRLREALTTPGAVNIRNDMLRAHRGKRILLAIDDFDVVSEEARARTNQNSSPLFQYHLAPRCTWTRL